MRGCGFQAEDVAGRMFQRGQETAQQLGRSFEQQPIMALVIVGLAVYDALTRL